MNITPITLNRMWRVNWTQTAQVPPMTRVGFHWCRVWHYAGQWGVDYYARTERTVVWNATTPDHDVPVAMMFALLMLIAPPKAGP